MTDPTPTSAAHHTDDAERVAERAHLLPEEIAAGSDDPTAQAEAILAESDERTAAPEKTQQASSQTNESGSEDF